MGPYKETILEKLINPDKIAVIGASNKTGKVGGIIFEGLTRSNAELLPVNPKEEVVVGHKSYSGVEDLPDPVDLAVIALPARLSVPAAEACAEKGIPFIIVVAGGFAEVGEEGSRLENRLKLLPEKYGCRILGPNTLGVFVPENNLDTIFVEHGDRSLAAGGGVAFITQSGSIGVESLGLAGNTGFGMRAFVGLGNKIDIDELEFLRYFGADAKTDCLAFYIETFEQGKTFLREAGEVSKEKPIVVLKAGRTEAGAAAVGSHTGRLAGSDRVVSGAFRQYGIQRAYDDEELCDAAKTLSMLPPPKGNRVAVVTPAGGFGVMCTDYIESESSRAALTMATLLPETKQAIRAHTLEIASCNNPIDLTAGADDTMYIRTLEHLLQDPGVDMIICIAFFAPPTISDTLIDLLALTIRGSRKPVLLFTEYGPFTEKYLRMFYDRGMIGFPSIGRVVRAARFLVERGNILGITSLDNIPPERGETRHGQPERGDSAERVVVGPGPTGHSTTSQRAASSGRKMVSLQAASSNPASSGRYGPAEWSDAVDQWKNSLLFPGKPNEWETKKLIRMMGIDVPRGVLLHPETNHVKDVRIDFPPPYVCKVCSGNIIHKTEHNGVVVGVSQEALQETVSDLRRKFPGEPILIEEMVRYNGFEFIVGALDDPGFGPAVMAGAGGILTELYRDVTFRLAPVSSDKAKRMLEELRVYPVLAGFRNIRMDSIGLATIIESIGAAAETFVTGGNQLDINPIVWNGERWIALDAKAVLR